MHTKILPETTPHVFGAPAAGHAIGIYQQYIERVCIREKNLMVSCMLCCITCLVHVWLCCITT